MQNIVFPTVFYMKVVVYLLGRISFARKQRYRLYKCCKATVIMYGRTVFAHTDLYKHCIPTLGHIHSLINKTVFPKGLRWHTADHNFQFSILHFQLKKNLPNTANAIFGRIFYLFTYSLCTSFSQNYSASGRLASFSR